VKDAPILLVRSGNTTALFDLVDKARSTTLAPRRPIRRTEWLKTAIGGITD
jgi:hypothetical protein